MFVGRGGSTFVSNTHHEIRRGSDGRGRPHRKNYLRGLWICWNLFLTCPGEELVYEIVVTITSTISVLSLITRAAIDDRQHPDSAESQDNVTIRVLLSSCTQPVDSLSFVVNELLTALNV
jgi:hypothetical protein